MFPCDVDCFSPAAAAAAATLWELLHSSDH